MNERIKQLAERAIENRPQSYVNSDGEVVVQVDDYGVNLQKFAELVIQDCFTKIQGDTPTLTAADTYDASVCAYHSGMCAARRSLQTYCKLNNLTLPE